VREREREALEIARKAEIEKKMRGFW